MRLEEIHARNPPLSEVDWKRVSEEMTNVTEAGKEIASTIAACYMLFGSKAMSIYKKQMIEQEQFEVDSAFEAVSFGLAANPHLKSKLDETNQAQEEAFSEYKHFIEAAKLMQTYLENKIRVILNPKTD